ncbi:hypothetical protein FRB99_001164 [Tulasnella sp. 403]|nr:hypothetical protein FRB99_001164 [Tulasnella sp. 403]
MALRVHPHGVLQPPQQQQHQSQPLPPPQQPHIPSHPQLPHPHSHSHSRSDIPPLLPPIATSSSASVSTPVDISQAAKASSRKRKKADSPEDAVHNQPPPARRLRRLHEACARCRSKKIKCDSKLPSCSACSAANVECNQEDRHRQTLKPRGYTDMVEAQLAKCILVLQKLVPNFKLADIDAVMEREGIHIPPSSAVSDAPEGSGSSINAALGAVLQANAAALGGIKTEPIVPTLSIPNGPVQSSAPPRASEGPSDGSSTVYDVRSNATQPSQPGPTTTTNGVKGQDPQANDLSSTGGLIKAFGVSRSIVRDLPKPASSSATSIPPPAQNTQTQPHPVASPAGGSGTPFLHLHPSYRARLAFRLPRNRELTQYVVEKYFERLNCHRPVFIPEEFNVGLSALYESLDDDTHNRAHSPQARIHPSRPNRWSNPPASVSLNPEDDPGFLCSVYLILALGRLCIDNEHMHEGKEGVPEIMKDYPTHEEFFELALAVKPDLRVTISSLQALILLQWYLYTERHGRTLWRLVGNLVRLSIELGLHHDPSEQGNTFTPAECEVRNRLWWTVLIHDRGTSVLLGRPLAIADADFNTPFPKRLCPHLPGGQFSEHYEHSPHLTSIQGDIINALYRPGNHKQTADQVVRHASRITKGLGAFSRGILGPSYRAFFEGTESWTNEQKIALVTQMTEDQGLTLLKYGIARILLLRALFTSSMLSADARRRALKDAVITSHNILTIQMQLNFPSLAFFVSPIPIHIAAMVILYGVISECDALPYSRAREDVCSALHIVPLFRWRWNRKDAHGSHPLIVKLAQKVFGHDVLNVAGPLGPPLLLPEWDWTTGQADVPPMMPPADSGMSPAVASQNLQGQGMGPQAQHLPVQQQVQNGGPMYQMDHSGMAPPSSQWDQNQQVVQGHSRHMSSGTVLPPTPVSATLPRQQPSPSAVMTPNGVSGNSMSSQMMMTGGPSPQDAQAPHQGQSVHYSPPTAAQHQMEQSIYPHGRIDEAEKDVIVRFMYPPPLDQHPSGYYDGDPQATLGLSTDAELQPRQPNMAVHAQPMHPHGMITEHDVVHVASSNTGSSHLPPHHSGHMVDGPNGMHGHSSMHANGNAEMNGPRHPQDIHGHRSSQHVAYTNMPADYNQSATHFVQEEYDGKQLIAGAGDILQAFSGW